MIVAPSAAPAPTEPLSHHALLRWAEPFVRAGWRIDGAASDRLARRIALAPAAPATGTRERLELQIHPRGCARLSQRSVRADGLEASLTVDGLGSAAALADAWQRLAALPRWQVARDGIVMALHLHAEPQAGAATPPVVRVVGATAAAGPFRLHGREVSRGERSARCTLDGPAYELAALPADVFAVLGPAWSLLQPVGADGRRHASVRQRAGTTPLPSIERAARQLARVHAEGLARFHDRTRWRRVGVAVQRALPWLAADLVVVEAGLAWPLQPVLTAPTVAAMAGVPLLMLAAWWRWTEDPRLDPPPWPRRSAA